MGEQWKSVGGEGYPITEGNVDYLSMALDASKTLATPYVAFQVGGEAVPRPSCPSRAPPSAQSSGPRQQAQPLGNPRGAPPTAEAEACSPRARTALSRRTPNTGSGPA